MDAKDLQYFKDVLNGMLDDILKKSEETIEDMTESGEVYADPADRATAESDRAFTLRLRDRERKLIKKIQKQWTALTMASSAYARSAETKYPSRASSSPHDNALHQLQEQTGRRRGCSRRLARLALSYRLYAPWKQISSASSPLSWAPFSLAAE